MAERRVLRTFRRRFFRTAVVVLAALASACRSAPRAQPPRGEPTPAPGTSLPGAASPAAAARRVPVQQDEVALYRRMGLLAEGGETPFVGSLAFFAGPSNDSTLIVLTVALANRALHFGREGDRYRAGYQVSLEVRRGTQLVRELTGKETVRVLVFRETMRTDESVLYRQVVNLAPGTYEVRLMVRDENAVHGSAVEATVGVPRFAEGSVSSPVPFYEASVRGRRDTLPNILATPRATVVFGRDSILPVYAEGYGSGQEFPLQVTVRGDEGNGVLWSEALSLPRRSDLFSGTFNIPIAKVGVGVMTVGISRAGSSDTVRTPVFVAFGEDLPVATFSEMLTYLRYYASAARLQALRDASAETRAALWASFLKETDPFPQTALHEGLRDYFARIAQANVRFREEGNDGWLTDRGRAYVALGNPDQVFEPNASNMGQRGATLVWDYRQYRLQIVFVDQSGFGRWRMTLSSESEFESVVRRVLVP
jgi:GWxTD domain-containing protein